MNIISNMTLKWKLGLLLLVPILGMIWFAQSEVQKSYALSSETQNLSQLVSLSVKISEVVHELQKERGATAVFIGSEGAKFASEISEQQKNTDALATELIDYVTEFPVDQFDKRLETKLEKPLASLKVLKEKHALIRKQNIELVAAIAYYSDMIANFLSLVELLPSLSSVGEVNNAAIAYVNFLQSKEKAGIERAVISAVFSLDAFSPGMYDKFRALITTQDNYINVFLSLATTEQKKFFNSTMQGRFIEDTNRMRKVAIENAEFGGFGVDSPHWFKMQTAKIDLLKRVENKLSSDLLTQVNTIEVAAERSILTALIIALVSVLMAGILGFLISCSLVRQIKKALGVAENIAKGNLDGTIDTGSKDETGQLLHALKSMQTSLREANDARDSVAAISRIKQALDNTSGNVMITDLEGNIVYMNKAVTTLMHEAEDDLREELPNFSAKSLIGENYDAFHKNPSHQRKILAELKDTYIANVKISNRTMRIIANPIIDSEGVRLGTVAEWIDRTQEVAIELEIQGIIDASRSGDLSQRIGLQNKEGFFERLSAGINDMVDASDQVINETANVMHTMADGDLTKSIQGDYKGSFGLMKNDINTTIAKFTHVLAEIDGNADDVLRGSQDIAKGNTSLSERTDEQASSLEKTAASMEEMTATVRQNADSVKEADQLVVQTREHVEKGTTVISEAVLAMDMISASSSRIAEIIGVIDEIAFQTNLLALNASVEAARAGEQGRGFAVVASEVRNLAGRSATAAKEIKELIEDSVAKVDEGGKLVGQSGKTLEDIMNSVTRVSTIVSKISTASKEQSEGIGQMNQAVAQIDTTTQQNASLVKEAANASEAMGESAKRLNELVSFFTTQEKPVNNVTSIKRNENTLTSNHETEELSENESSLEEEDNGTSLKITGTENAAWENF